MLVTSDMRGFGLPEVVVAQSLSDGDRNIPYTGDGAEVEVSATGPFKITYVNPGDDPRGAAKPKE